jgi:NADH dehydrogenase
MIMADQAGSRRLPFVYNDKGLMATIGKNKAVLRFKNIEMDGYLAWIGWLVVHIYYLASFRNKVSVFLQWVWSYLLSKRSSRLILESKDVKVNRNLGPFKIDRPKV